MGCTAPEVEKRHLLPAFLFEDIQHDAVAGVGVFLALRPANAKIAVAVRIQEALGQPDDLPVWLLIQWCRHA